MLACRATIDVPRELVQYLARLLQAERRAVGTRRKARALTCFYQALFVRTYNPLLRGMRRQGDRGFAILIGRWKALRHTSISPRRSATLSPPRCT